MTGEADNKGKVPFLGVLGTCRYLNLHALADKKKNVVGVILITFTFS